MVVAEERRASGRDELNSPVPFTSSDNAEHRFRHKQETRGGSLIKISPKTISSLASSSGNAHAHPARGKEGFL